MSYKHEYHFVVLWLLLSFAWNVAQVEIFEKFNWVKPESYYFHQIEDKIQVMISQNCTKMYKIIENSKQLDIPMVSSNFNIIISPINMELYNWWKSIPKPQQMRVDPNLCDVIKTKKRPIFENKGCQLPHYMALSAPRCQTSYLKWICEESRLPINQTKPNHFVVPESNHQTWLDPPAPYIIVAKDAFSTMCGQLKTSCGIIHSNTNCMSIGQRPLSDAFAKKCDFSLIDEYHQRSKQYNIEEKDPHVGCARGTPFSDDVYLHDKVFVVAQVDDTYIYHIHLEIFPRIVYYLEYLQKHPDIKILIACDSKNKKSITAAGIQEGMRSVYLLADLFRIDRSRFIIHRHIYAHEVYLPMEGACQDPVFNTWHILSMREKIGRMLKLPSMRQTTNRIVQPPITTTASANKRYRPVIVLMRRSATSQHTRNKHDSARQWNDAFTERLLLSLRMAYPSFDVRLYSDRNETLMTCFSCQVETVAKADVLIGVHGAALSMMLYMPPNSAVIEIAPYGNDGRCLLGGGPFSRLAAVMAHNYMIHHPLYEEFAWKNDRTSEFDLDRFLLHTTSYLRSIQFIS